MSRDQMTIGSDTRPPVLFRGDFEQWRVRFFDFIERQPFGEYMLEIIQEGPKPIFAVITNEDGTTTITNRVKQSNEWTNDEKDYVKSIKLAKSHIINAIPNDIFMNIDSRETAREMFDEITNQMQGSRAGKNIKMINAINKFESFKAQEDEMLEQTYNRFCGILNELRKNGFQKSSLEVNVKFMKTLKPTWKRFTSNIMQNMNIQNTPIHDIFECLMQNEEEVVEAENEKKIKKEIDPLALMMNKIDELTTKSSLFEHQSKAFLHNSSSMDHQSKALHNNFQSPSSISSMSHNEFKEKSQENDNSEEELSQMIALLSNMMQKRRFGNGQRFQGDKRNFNNFNNRSSYNQNHSQFNNNESSRNVPQMENTNDQDVPNKEASRDISSVICYKCMENGHFARDCKVRVVKNSEYYRKKMLFERKREMGGEKGQAFLSEDTHWLSDSDNEEQASAHFAHMSLMADVDLDMLDEDEVGNYITNPVRLQTCVTQMRFLESKLRDKILKIKTLEENVSHANATTKKYFIENENFRSKINQLNHEVLDFKKREQHMNSSLSEATITYQALYKDSSLHKTEVERISKKNLELCSQLKELENQVMEKNEMIKNFRKEITCEKENKYFERKFEELQTCTFQMTISHV